MAAEFLWYTVHVANTEAVRRAKPAGLESGKLSGLVLQAG